MAVLVSGTALGLLIAPSPQLLHALGADVTFPAFFLVLALDEVRKSRRAIGATVLGASIAAALIRPGIRGGSIPWK